MMMMATMGTAAQQAPEWKNPQVNQMNREARRADFFAFENADKAKAGDKTKSDRYLSMEGKWKFNFVKDHNLAPKDFYTVKFDDSKWVDFPVPGLFEMEGYGDKIYKNVGYSEDSKVAAEFNITKYLKKGQNLIAMQVMRWCDGS